MNIAKGFLINKVTQICKEYLSPDKSTFRRYVEIFQTVYEDVLPDKKYLGKYFTLIQELYKFFDGSVKIYSIVQNVIDDLSI